MLLEKYQPKLLNPHPGKDLASRVVELEEELVASERRCGELRSMMESKNEKLAVAEEKISVLTSRVEGLTEERAGWDADLTSKVSDLESELQRANQFAASVQADLSLKAHHLTQANTEISALKMQMQLQQDTKASQSAAEVERAVERAAEAARLLGEAQRRCKELEVAVEQRQRDAELASAKMLGLQDRLDDAAAREQVLLDKFSALSAGMLEFTSIQRSGAGEGFGLMVPIIALFSYCCVYCLLYVQRRRRKFKVSNPKLKS